MYTISTKNGMFCNCTIRVPAELKLKVLQHGINQTEACIAGLTAAVDKHEKGELIE